MELVQPIPKTVVDSIVSRSVSGVSTASTKDCGGQYCQKCIWSLYRQDK